MPDASEFNYQPPYPDAQLACRQQKGAGRSSALLFTYPRGACTRLLCAGALVSLRPCIHDPLKTSPSGFRINPFPSVALAFKISQISLGLSNFSGNNEGRPSCLEFASNFIHGAFELRICIARPNHCFVSPAVAYSASRSHPKFGRTSAPLRPRSAAAADERYQNFVLRGAGRHLRQYMTVGRIPLGRARCQIPKTLSSVLACLKNVQTKRATPFPASTTEKWQPITDRCRLNIRK